jgi:hypothetical protein
MNKRIFKKIYKRAEYKLEQNKKPRDRRTYEEKLQVLSSIELKVWNIKQNILCNITDSIIKELKAEGKW